MFLTKNGKIQSAIGQLGGTKKNPRSIGNLCYIQEDNILAEANIPPVTTFEEFKNYINYIKDHLRHEKGYNLLFSSSEVIPNELLREPKAMEFGCEKSLLVDYNEDGDEIPDLDFHKDLEIKSYSDIRVGGFHIHYGYDNPSPEVNRELIKLFDKNVTLALLKYDNDKNQRRLFYGKSGEYRNKPYGVEARSLGSGLLKSNATLKLVWDGIQKTISDFNSGDRVSTQEFEIIKEIINNNKTI
jgi:hypothetical protein